MASAVASMSQKSTLMAYCSTSETPDCLDITTGTPDCMASNGEMPKGSEIEGMTYTSLMPNILSMSLPRRKPVKWKRSEIPNSATRRMTRGIMSPSPASTKRTLSSISSTRLAVSTKYSGPFWKVTRPRKVTIFSFTGRLPST